MTLDDDHTTAHLDRLEALERDHQRDLADRLAALLERDEVESVEAVEAHWEGAFRQGACHYSSRQTWDGT